MHYLVKIALREKLDSQKMHYCAEHHDNDTATMQQRMRASATFRSTKAVKPLVVLGVDPKYAATGQQATVGWQS